MRDELFSPSGPLARVALLALLGGIAYLVLSFSTSTLGRSTDNPLATSAGRPVRKDPKIYDDSGWVRPGYQTKSANGFEWISLGGGKWMRTK
jgi:hypothetical protein